MYGTSDDPVSEDPSNTRSSPWPVMYGPPAWAMGAVLTCSHADTECEPESQTIRSPRWSPVASPMAAQVGYAPVTKTIEGADGTTPALCRWRNIRSAPGYIATTSAAQSSVKSATDTKSGSSGNVTEYAGCGAVSKSSWSKT